MLTATFDNYRFVLTGAAATSSPYSRVNINDSDGTMTVEDNNSPSTRVPVFGLSNSVAVSFDVSGLTGTGATIFSANNARVTITGSNQNDYIARFDNNYSNDYITGGLGNDTISAGSGNDVFGGGQGNDSLDGGAGNDFIYGGTGSDQIDGGEGFDTLVLRGSRADYDLSINDGSYVLTYLRGGLDGVNTFANVERLSFADQVMDPDWFFA